MDAYPSLTKFNESSLPENFVSIAVRIEDHEASHAGILIRYRGINFLHHFPGGDPPVVEENFNEDGWYVYKIMPAFEVEDENEIGSFLQYCKRVCSHSQISYSYIADGSSYEDRGFFISRIGLPEMGTCVGFCLNTLNNALIGVEQILQLDDWSDSEVIEWVDHWGRAQVLKKYPDIDWNLYNAFRKRITPLEYLCSSLVNNYPIRKVTIDSLKPAVQRFIDSRF